MELVPPRDSSLSDTTRAVFRYSPRFSHSEELPATTGQSGFELEVKRACANTLTGAESKHDSCAAFSIPGLMLLV